MPQTETKRLVVTLPEAVYWKVKSMAVTQKTSVSELIANLVLKKEVKK